VDQDRNFDIVIEYAKVNPEDLCIRIEAFNRGPEAAPLHILPHLWFRNIWSWSGQPTAEPIIQLGPEGPDYLSLVADDAKLSMPIAIPVHYRLGPRTLYASRGGIPLFTDNETNMARVFGPRNVSRKPYVKDAFHRWIVHGEPCVNPDQVGTKAALHYRFDTIPPGESAILRLRLSNKPALKKPLAH